MKRLCLPRVELHRLFFFVRPRMQRMEGVRREARLTQLVGEILPPSNSACRLQLINQLASCMKSSGMVRSAMRPISSAVRRWPTVGQAATSFNSGMISIN